MDILNIVLKCIGIIIIALGIVSVYDARKLTKKFFGTADTNSATKTFKVVGFFISLIGGAILLFTV